MALRERGARNNSNDGSQEIHIYVGMAMENGLKTTFVPLMITLINCNSGNITEAVIMIIVIMIKAMAVTIVMKFMIVIMTMIMVVIISKKIMKVVTYDHDLDNDHDYDYDGSRNAENLQTISLDKHFSMSRYISFTSFY